IVLRVPWAVLTLTHSALNTSNAIEPEDCVDWLGEIANQIIGRLKQKLLRHGCPVQIGLPKTTPDASFEYPLSPLALKIPRAFELEDERIECLLAVEILSEALVLAPEREQEGNSSSGDQYDEGELELF
ncbi:MAG: chemotaxis protein CheX, partial [Pseudomonadales bacterium]|nr:chemotaxis protein CheX [Pseudomonadales bacterium]